MGVINYKKALLIRAVPLHGHNKSLNFVVFILHQGLSWWLSSKESSCQCRGDVDLIPGSARSLGEGNGNPLQLLLPEKSHGQRSLVGYIPWSRKRVGHDLATKPQQLLYTKQCDALCSCT